VLTGVGVDVSKCFRARVLKPEAESEKCDSAYLWHKYKIFVCVSLTSPCSLKHVTRIL